MCCAIRISVTGAASACQARANSAKATARSNPMRCIASGVKRRRNRAAALDSRLLAAAQRDEVVRHLVMAGMHHLVVHGKHVDVVEEPEERTPQLGHRLAVHVPLLADLGG